ncbi:hypothetical protein Ae263Ps1_6413 [Pseudonocardia sp. Ae263_Ps1]|nr:hypothetical protein Ae263Ps1_6413 [Pseudonocardia sp. Ae263_Ps1]
MAAWDRGEDLSLAEVDRRIGGNWTAAKAKRNLRDRGIFPPSEQTLDSTSPAGQRPSVQAAMARVSALSATSSSQLA